jgi:hypothetical protein
MPYFISPPPPRNPLTRIVAAIIAVLSLVGALMLGAVALFFVLGAGAIAAIALWLRVAWIKRKLRQSGVDFPTTPDPEQDSGQVIEAEYTVVTKKSERQDV